MIASAAGQCPRPSAVSQRAEPATARPGRTVSRGQPGQSRGPGAAAIPAGQVRARPAARSGAGLASAGRGRTSGLGGQFPGRPESHQRRRHCALDGHRAARHRRGRQPGCSRGRHGLPPAPRPPEAAASRGGGDPEPDAGACPDPGRIPGHHRWQPAGVPRPWRVSSPCQQTKSRRGALGSCAPPCATPNAPPGWIRASRAPQ